MMSGFFSAVTAGVIKQQKKAIYPDTVLFLDGNSLTRSNHGNSVEQYVSTLLHQYFLPKCQSLTTYSIGVGGQHLQTMLDNYSANVDPYYDSDKLNILIFSESENGIGNSPGGEDTGAGNLSKMNTYLGYANSTGWDIIVTWNAWYKRTPYAAGDDAAARQRRKDYFDLVDAGGLVGNTINLDMRTLPNVGGASGQAQDEYFSDHIHLSTIGYQELANRFILELEDLLEPYRI